MKPTELYSIAIVALFALAATPAIAESLSSADIVRELAPQKTRSLSSSTGGQAEMTSGDRQFVRSLGTRQIKVEQREKIDGIVNKYQLPKIDIAIYFAFNSTRIENRSMDDLRQLGAALLNPQLAGSRILLNGHTDSVGSHGYNQQLSEQRSSAVKRFLIDEFVVPSENLIAIGYGEERPKNPDDPRGAENRRVEIVNLGDH
jgi:outer membrane protein OmpA-like peptidoglycan-associated protein